MRIFSHRFGCVACVKVMDVNDAWRCHLPSLDLFLVWVNLFILFFVFCFCWLCMGRTNTKGNFKHKLLWKTKSVAYSRTWRLVPTSHAVLICGATQMERRNIICKSSWTRSGLINRKIKMERIWWLAFVRLCVADIWCHTELSKRNKFFARMSIFRICSASIVSQRILNGFENQTFSASTPTAQTHRYTTQKS